jgi:hypothetical protein
VAGRLCGFRATAWGVAPAERRGFNAGSPPSLFPRQMAGVLARMEVAGVACAPSVLAGHRPALVARMAAIQGELGAEGRDRAAQAFVALGLASLDCHH